MAGKYHVRSVSLPAASHPTSIRIEQELNSLKSWDSAPSTSTANAVCSSLARLEQLYNCVDELLNMQTTEATLSAHKTEQWVADLFDASVKILDVCSISRDTLQQVNQHVQNLQSALRRRKGDPSIERCISSYKCFRKNMRKDATRMIATLKTVDRKIRASSLNSVDIDCSKLIRVLAETTTTTISIFEPLLSFLSVPLAQTTKWSLVPRLMNKRVAACYSEMANEFVSADAALVKCLSSEGSQSTGNLTAVKRLRALETSLEGIEDCLEDLFRSLVRSRVCLLNVMSH